MFGWPAVTAGDHGWLCLTHKTHPSPISPSPDLWRKAFEDVREQPGQEEYGSILGSQARSVLAIWVCSWWATHTFPNSLQWAPPDTWDSHLLTSSFGGWDGLGTVELQRPKSWRLRGPDAWEP